MIESASVAMYGFKPVLSQTPGGASLGHGSVGVIVPFVLPLSGYALPSMTSQATFRVCASSSEGVAKPLKQR
jgi:hypothetical protein